MAEQLEPTVNQVLFVTERDRELMQPWPLELRALFDPQADRQLAARIQRETAEERPMWAEEEIPF